MSQKDGVFHHERDPKCSYFEEMSKRCQSEGGGQMTCKLVQKLLRKCPNKAVEEVERVETDSKEGAEVRDGTEVRGFGQERFGQHMDGRDPFDLMRRSMDEMMSDFMMQHPFGRMFEGQFPQFPQERGDFGQQFGAVPPHHRHRYGVPQEQEERSGPNHRDKGRWNSYDSEDV